MIRIIVVDDEPIARNGLAVLIEREADLTLLGTAASGSEAVRLINERHPDVVFLDIQLPDLSGFDVLEALDAEVVPFVVFVTAYEEYAIRAFDAEAIDYLLKPFDRERLGATLQRVRRRMTDGFSRLLIRDAGRAFFLPLDDIDYLEAAGNYVRVFASGAAHVIRGPLTGLAHRLPQTQFVRVSRRHVVNVGRVSEMIPHGAAPLELVLRSGARLLSSRRFRASVIDAIDTSRTR